MRVEGSHTPFCQVIARPPGASRSAHASLATATPCSDGAFEYWLKNRNRSVPPGARMTLTSPRPPTTKRFDEPHAIFSAGASSTTPRSSQVRPRSKDLAEPTRGTARSVLWQAKAGISWW